MPGSFGPIDPTQPSTWTFLRAFFAEVAEVFPDAYIHAGGDEVNYDCWASNPAIAAWMAANGVPSYSALESYYVERNIGILDALGKSVVACKCHRNTEPPHRQPRLTLAPNALTLNPVTGQEVFDNNLSLPAQTIVHVWKGGGNWSKDATEMARVTAGGFRALLSADWYESRIQFGPQWRDFYQIDPTNFEGSDAQKALVMGGELAAWGEFIDGVNLVSRVFPFAGAIAERLWSPATFSNVSEATPRLLAQRCRLLARGINAEVADGPSFCPSEFEVVYSPPWAT